MKKARGKMNNSIYLGMSILDISKTLMYGFWHFEVYDVYNTFCSMSWKEKRYDIETLFIDLVLNKEHFYGKIMQRICTKS